MIGSAISHGLLSDVSDSGPEGGVLIVQKFGGTSVGTPKRILRVADRIAERHTAGDRVVAVVSAMGQSTDHLLALAARITERPSRRETDMLLTAGERISMALLSMALDTRGIPAISFTGSQSGILTDSNHTRARILEIRPLRIGPELEKGRVVIVAGFQGVSAAEKEITTLGRGGSDTTAVALAVGLGADLCEIYTDVPGVMTADPRIVPSARVLERLPWDTMLLLAAHGAGVMHSRAVELARRRRVSFCVRSTFRRKGGTLVEGQPIEQGPSVAAITGLPRVAYVRLAGIASGLDRAELLEAIDRLLADADGIAGWSMEEGPGGGTLAFHVPLNPEVGIALEKLVGLAQGHGTEAGIETGLAAVTLVGTGLLDAPATAARASRTLTRAGVVVRGVSCGDLSLTLLVSEGAFTQAQLALHHEFLETAGR